MDPQRSFVDSLPKIVREFWPRKGTYSGDVLQSLITNVAIAGLGVISGVLLARLLGPEGRGELAAIQALPHTVVGIGHLGLNEAVVYFAGKDRGRVGRYSVSAAALLLLTAIPIIAVTALITPRFLDSYSPGVVLAGQIYLGLLLVSTIDGLAINTARGLHRISLWNGLRFCPRILWVVVVVLSFAFGPANPQRIALTFLLLYFPLAGLMVYAVREQLRGHWRPKPALWPGMLRFGLPVAAGITPRLLNERFDQVLVAWMLPAADLGLYAVAVAWSGLCTLPGLAMSMVGFSKLAGMPDWGQKVAFIRKATWVVAVVAGIAALGLGIVTPLVIDLAFGEEFHGSIPLSWIMLLATVLRSVAWMLQAGVQGLGRPLIVMYSHWSGFALFIPAILLLVPRFGITGAAWALVVSAGTAAFVALVLCRRAAARPPEPD